MKLNDQRWHADDYDLRRRILNFLHTCRLPGITELRLDVASGRVVVRGQFHSDRERQWCLQLIRHVRDVHELADESELLTVSKLSG